MPTRSRVKFKRGERYKYKDLKFKRGERYKYRDLKFKRGKKVSLRELEFRLRRITPTPELSQAAVRWKQVKLAVKIRGREIGEELLRREQDNQRQEINHSRETLANQLTIPQEPQEWSNEDCQNAIKGLNSDWKHIHATLKNDTEALKKLVDFRKQLVDSLIDEMRQKYPGLVASSVGSSDLTSDYDVTLGVTDGSVNDVKAVQELNARLKEIFGKQPGTVFDTNFYTNNFLTLKENILTDGSVGEVAPADSPNEATAPITTADQDVLALLKQRRYMDQIKWDDYVKEVTNDITDPTKRAETRRQYDTANDIYQISLQELLEATGEPSESVQLTAEEESLIELQPVESHEQFRNQLLLSHKIRAQEESNSDLVLEKSNELYNNRMLQVRELQAQVAALPDQNSEEAQNLKAEVERQLSNALFFASEAYHSKGTILHVVEGIQGKNQEVLAALTPNQILDSVNEQLGDFLKDIRHYTAEEVDDGTTFYRASKYMHRLFDAVNLLKEKEAIGDLDFESQYGSTKDLYEAIGEVLLPARKGKFGLSPEETMELARDTVWNMYQIITAEELEDIVLSLVKEVNIVARDVINFDDADVSELLPE
ncbi:hypothetical protein BJP36_03430 [Moorena producens JHB]|uniref:Uncharacterized protein n=1 Tax=Moorena producens (strain JHB) TaxID=1454205 RepID=A0A1D9FUX0_MOOP1|nr:hypothetical protein [Moorena producens]AOY79103.1 hypothetical protein BJP36_03430 [Moorena producens JHB]